MSSSASTPPNPQLTKIGTFKEEDVLECQLRSSESDDAVLIFIMNFGATIRDWQVPLANGKNQRRSVVLGFPEFRHYPDKSPFFGAIVGRVANRIGGAKFQLDGQEYSLPTNEGRNHLHGGPATFGKRIWKMLPLAPNAVQLELESADGDGGYPGQLNARVLYKLEGHRLTIEFEAETHGKATPVNLVQHNYFNLAGHGDIRTHRLQLKANSFTPFSNEKVPTGDILPIEDGTDLDFRPKGGRLLTNSQGNPMELDHNFVVDSSRNARKDPVAVLTAPDGKLQLRLWSDQPGLQVYTGGGLNQVDVPGLGGQLYPQYGAICLEDQLHPDAINHPAKFGTPVIRPGQVYKHWCQIEIGPAAV